MRGYRCRSLLPVIDARHLLSPARGLPPSRLRLRRRRSSNRGHAAGVGDVVIVPPSSRLDFQQGQGLVCSSDHQGV
ncbi:hypothetical protein OPV22_007898 [Ensete ventricosum]|uniref:Uncharacterized protein n=1 Tax=Ensete ventricosum TaxID=4639 RepID=A0AAV8RBH7_ENSVE|nr:hypothetical protein OPV22_007898 [Ensete ventricosum]